MSLIKQLWIGITIMLLLVLGGNFAISTITAKTYLQEQLRLKNMDNANSLALSISQMAEKDPVTLELLITAQFDAGHYEYIIFNDVNDEIQDAKELLAFTKNVPCKVNIIEYNPISMASFTNADVDKVDAFAEYLRKHGVVTKVRRSR